MATPPPPPPPQQRPPAPPPQQRPPAPPPQQGPPAPLLLQGPPPLPPLQGVPPLPPLQGVPQLPLQGLPPFPRLQGLQLPLQQRLPPPPPPPQQQRLPQRPLRWIIDQATIRDCMNKNDLRGVYSILAQLFCQLDDVPRETESSTSMRHPDLMLFVLNEIMRSQLREGDLNGARRTFNEEILPLRGSTSDRAPADLALQIQTIASTLGSMNRLDPLTASEKEDRSRAMLDKIEDYFCLNFPTYIGHQYQWLNSPMYAYARIHFDANGRPIRTARSNYTYHCLLCGWEKTGIVHMSVHLRGSGANRCLKMTEYVRRKLDASAGDDSSQPIVATTENTGNERVSNVNPWTLTTESVQRMMQNQAWLVTDVGSSQQPAAHAENADSRPEGGDSRVLPAVIAENTDSMLEGAPVWYQEMMSMVNVASSSANPNIASSPSNMAAAATDPNIASSPSNMAAAATDTNTASSPTNMAAAPTDPNIASFPSNMAAAATGQVFSQLDLRILRNDLFDRIMTLFQLDSNLDVAPLFDLYDKLSSQFCDILVPRQSSRVAVSPLINLLAQMQRILHQMDVFVARAVLLGNMSGELHKSLKELIGFVNGAMRQCLEVAVVPVAQLRLEQMVGNTMVAPLQQQQPGVLSGVEMNTTTTTHFQQQQQTVAPDLSNSSPSWEYQLQNPLQSSRTDMSIDNWDSGLLDPIFLANNDAMPQSSFGHTNQSTESSIPFGLVHPNFLDNTDAFPQPSDGQLPATPVFQNNDTEGSSRGASDAEFGDASRRGQ